MRFHSKISPSRDNGAHASEMAGSPKSGREQFRNQRRAGSMNVIAKVNWQVSISPVSGF
jgi:hypothetical protein